MDPLLQMNQDESLLQMNQAESLLQMSHLDSLLQVSRFNQPTIVIKPSISSFIFFDIETGGLRITDDILEIAAVWGDNEFDIYIRPQNPIPEGASAVNHITFVDNVLYYKDKKVDSNPLSVALEKFLEFIEGTPEPRILIGHNIKTFDCRFLFTALSKLNLLQNLEDLVVGFIDTLPLYKEFQPGLESYKQSNIVKSLLGIDYEAHNALADVSSLRNVFDHSHFDDPMLMKHLFTCLDMNKKLLAAKKGKVLVDMRNNPMIRLPLTDYMIKKIVDAGLSIEDLASAFETDGIAGLRELLQGRTNRCVKITDNENIIDGLCNFFLCQFGESGRVCHPDSIIDNSLQ